MFAERIRLVPALLLALLPLAAAGAMPGIEQWQTDNGARVLFVEAHEIPLVEVQVTFAAGAARDGAHPGIAQLVSDLLMSGTKSRDADALAAALEREGAEVSTGAARDMGWVEFRSLSEPEHLEPVVETVADLLAHPAFPQGEVERLKARQRTQLEDQEQRPRALAERAFWRAVYARHPYGHPQLGTLESLATIGRDEVRGFHRRYYVARNANIAVVGDLDRAQAERLAERLAASLRTGEPAPPLPAVPRVDEDTTIARAFPSTQAHVTLGHTGIARGHPQWPALYVANHILGGGGFTSRLMSEVREKRGLVYGIYSHFSPMAVPGPFRVSLQTRGDQVDEALQLVRAELERFIDQGPTDEEVADARRNIVGGFPLQVDSNAKLAGYLAMIGFYDLPLDYLTRFRERVEAVDRAAVRAAVQSFLAGQARVTVIVGGDRVQGGGG